MTSPVRAPRPTPRRIAEPAPAPRRPHLRVVPPPAKPKVLPSVRRRRTGAILGVAMLVVFGSLMASALFHGLLVSGQADLDRVDAKIQEERTALAQEKLELAYLQSPGRIAEEAKDKGMVPAEQQHWVTPGTGDEPVVTGKVAEEPDTVDTDGDGIADSPADAGADIDTDGTGTTDAPDTNELASASGGGTAR